MTSDYDRLRQQLDDQLRADIEMIYAASLADMQRVYTAYLARVRAAETLAGGQSGAGGRPALDLGSVFPAFLGQAAIPLAVVPALSPHPAVAALPPGPAAAAPPTAPAPAAKRRRAKSPNHEVYDAVVAVLDQVPEVFDRNDLLRLLPIKPHRSTLFRILQVLAFQDKVIVHVEGSGYGGPNRYRKVAPPPVSPVDRAP